jgi:hypothetical protein
MAQDYEFKTYTAEIEDDDGDKHTSSIEAHVVTDKTRGQFNTRVGADTARPGDVLVKTSRPDVYDKHSSEEFDKLGYESGESDSEFGTANGI